MTAKHPIKVKWQDSPVPNIAERDLWKNTSLLDLSWLEFNIWISDSLLTTHNAVFKYFDLIFCRQRWDSRWKCSLFGTSPRCFDNVPFSHSFRLTGLVSLNTAKFKLMAKNTPLSHRWPHKCNCKCIIRQSWNCKFWRNSKSQNFKFKIYLAEMYWFKNPSSSMLISSFVSALNCEITAFSKKVELIYENMWNKNVFPFQCYFNKQTKKLKHLAWENAI